MDVLYAEPLMLITESFNNQCLCSGEVEVDHLTWQHMCYLHMSLNANYIYYVYLCITWLCLQPSSIIHVDTVVE